MNTQVIKSLYKNMKNITESEVGKVNSIQCWEALQTRPNSYLIDVRTPEEWQETGIADLSSIKKDVNLLAWIFFTPHIHPNNDFLKELEHILPSKQAELFFMCKSGGRSMQAANAALSRGYNKVYNVDGGFVGNIEDNSGWMNSKLPRRAV